MSPRLDRLRICLSPELSHAHPEPDSRAGEPCPVNPICSFRYLQQLAVWRLGLGDRKHAESGSSVFWLLLLWDPPHPAIYYAASLN
jgi:hypothetical protein